MINRRERTKKIEKEIVCTGFPKGFFFLFISFIKICINNIIKFYFVYNNTRFMYDNMKKSMYMTKLSFCEKEINTFFEIWLK